MSPTQRLKRVLVSILLELARVYSLDLNLSRDAPDADVKRAFRRVIIKAHPDKGGSEAATKKLNEAWVKWSAVTTTASQGCSIFARSRSVALCQKKHSARVHYMSLVSHVALPKQLWPVGTDPVGVHCAAISTKLFHQVISAR